MGDTNTDEISEESLCRRMCLVENPGNLWLAERVAHASRAAGDRASRDRDESASLRERVLGAAAIFILATCAGHIFWVVSGGDAHMAVDAARYWLTTAALIVSVLIGRVVSLRNAPFRGEVMDAELAYWALGGLLLPLVVPLAIQHSVIWLLPAFIVAWAARVLLAKLLA